MQKNQTPAEGNHSANQIAPHNLWLQWHGDGTPEDDGEVCDGEVTWSREKIFEHDVEYVHADEIRRALMGDSRSELWGDNGLIAATMRCVAAMRENERMKAGLISIRARVRNSQTQTSSLMKIGMIAEISLEDHS